MAGVGAASIALTTFSRTSLRSYEGIDVDAVLANVDRDANTWIHLVQPDVRVAAAILERFGLPPGLAEHLDTAAALELDTSSVNCLLKKFRFIETTAGAGARAGADGNVLIRRSETDRLVEGAGCLIVGEKLVLLVEDDFASPLVAKAIDSALQRERDLMERGVEYLLYRLTKSLFVDNYTSLMRGFLEKLQELEPKLLEGSTDAEIYREVTRLRRKLNPFERSLIHMTEFTSELAADGHATKERLGWLTGTLRAACAGLERELTMLRERTSQLIDTYRDNIDRQLNNTMRTLTVLSAIFLPLSFVTSFYGMNFTNMPAFQWRGGFPFAIAIMLAIFVGSLAYARRKKWL